jgi:hypothetical protein
MPRPDFPPAVLAFVAEHVRTLAELQLLMAVVQSADRWWDAASAAGEIGMSAAEARAALDRFAAHNLLDIRITGDLRYQFRPGTPELGEASEAVVEAYRRRPLDLARLVERPARRGVADFADAFRIRRDDDR